MGLDEGVVCERLQKVNASQESVQSTSGWILTHKDEIDVITRCWIKVYQQGSESQRVGLIYVVNDVVQTAKRERDKTISVAFHPHFVNAIVLASETVKKAIRRCLQVFRERHIYPKHIIDEMQSALEGTVDAVVQDEDDGEFEIEGFLKTLRTYVESSTAIDKARVVLNNINFDESNVDLSDREGLSQMELEVDLMIQKLQTFLQRIEGLSAKSAKVNHTIAKSKGFFQNQLKDVALVHDAYDRYAKGISERIEQLDPIVKSGILPGQTPPRDAPSPVPGEDIFNATGSDDMEMDEEDMPGKPNATSLIPPQNYVPNYNGVGSDIKVTPNVTMKAADPRQRFQPPPMPPYPTGFSEGVAPFMPSIPPPMMNFPPPFDAQVLPPGVEYPPPSTSISPPGEDLDLRKQGNGSSNGNTAFQPQYPHPSGPYIPSPGGQPPYDRSFDHKRRNGFFNRDGNGYGGGPPRKNFRRGGYQNSH
ncbi:unnamed protein product [Bursaphelenchus okinawaensis]|uniref:CID domain-containing protein n=1 Tax=Bursaphelenchus okinawaensis TaxID=465554 RepID=A0A811JSA1_9BILA|nr:unnamed protein product [Bursaphelenchus okinawaensis]CAG9080744.1 unnamed protein product [Bursaphelenchus okinawaensis]